MKKYIWGVLLALTTLTSCKMSDGQDREPIDIGEYVASMALVHYKYDAADQVTHALILDWYLSTGDESIATKFFGDYGVERLESGDVALIRYFAHADPRTVISFATDGKLLSEGGTWVVNGYSNIEITIASKGEGKYKYTIASYTRLYDYGIDIEVLACDLLEGLKFKMDGYIDFDVTSGVANVNTRAELTSDITESLVYHVADKYHSCFLEGSIYAVYEDPIHDIVDKVTIRLNGTNEADVSYMGFSGKVRINESWLGY